MPEHPAEPLSPEQVGAALVKRDDIVVVDLRQYPFLFAPHAGAVRPLGRLVTVFEQLHPCLCIASGKGLEIVLHFQQRTARLAAIDNRVERILRSALLVDALKPCSI